MFRPGYRRLFATVGVVVVAGVLAGVVSAAVSPPSTPGAEFAQGESGHRQPGHTVTEPVLAPAGLTAPIRLRTCVVSPPEGDPGQLDVHGALMLAETGETLWEVAAGKAVAPASVLKLVTARAALRVLGPDFRFTTQVVEGVEPGEVWLVGGGDPTLSRTSTAAATYYTDPARLDDLSQQVARYLGSTGSVERISTVGVDGSRYADFPDWNESWRPYAWRFGFVAPVTALMVDGGRLVPSDRLSERTSDPLSQATNAFASALGQATGSWRVEKKSGISPPAGRVIATVHSPPLSHLLVQMIRDSDNQIAEALIREVALALSTTDFDEAARAGLMPDAAHHREFYADDGSGLAQTNRMSAGLATAIVADLLADAEAAVIVAALARPGSPGSLEQRFATSDLLLASEVRAKTGSLAGVRSLAGYIEGPDPLVFSLFVVGSRVDDATRDVIDRLVGEFHACGENLAQ